MLKNIKSEHNELEEKYRMMGNKTPSFINAFLRIGLRTIFCMLQLHYIGNNITKFN